MKRKVKINYHTHTYRCRHAVGSDEQYVLAAIDAGFKVLGFSDHAPFEGVYHSTDRMDMDQLHEYISAIRILQTRYKKKIEIKVGFEAEYYPEYHHHYQMLLEEADYLILGQHYKVLNEYGYDYYSTDKDVEIYTEQVIAAMRSGFFAYVAHPDYFMIGRSRFSEVCAQAAHAIAQVAVETNTPLEINLNGFRHGKSWINQQYDYAYPYQPFWEIMSQYPIRAVIGYDAHAPLTLHKDDNLALALEILKDLPIKIEDDFRIV
jgi:histidinol-phosphatase (PHP family)